jgi:predicted AlkP superfamily pyrophosphatase or phosphodiesterase
MNRRQVSLAAPILLFFLLIAACDSGAGSNGRAASLKLEDRVFATDDPLQRGCLLSRENLLRIRRGYYEGRSEDIIMVPQFPNFSGSFSIPNHSGPWRYLQRVPLVFYGPAHIAKAGPIEADAGLIDVYPTVSTLLGVETPTRAGTILSQVIRKGGSTPPKLIVVVVWDGVGRNVLERWPDAWPELARMEKLGVSYLDATVGSSPSITPATHSTLGTGVFPLRHGVTGINYRAANGELGRAFNHRDPGLLRVTTFADEVDRALGNQPKVGMLAWKSWHFGMLGHGSSLSGGDRDQLGLMQDGESITGNPRYYTTPNYLNHISIQSEVERVDREDGSADERWFGHTLLELHDNPGWVRYQSKAILAMLSGEGFGGDDVPDIFLTNFKPTDIVGHQYGMDSPEMEVVLRAQDQALEQMVNYLDRRVKDYAVIVTADHGHTPSPTRTGAWPITNGEVRSDIDRHFRVPENESLVQDATAVGLFLNHDLSKQLNVSDEDIARFVNQYSMQDNWEEEELPRGYEGRAEEELFSAAFPSRLLPDIVKCASES